MLLRPLWLLPPPAALFESTDSVEPGLLTAEEDDVDDDAAPSVPCTA
jgi:hypothetical protein